MKKLLKICGILLAVFLVLLAGSAVAIRILLPPAKLKALVLAKSSESLKREVQLGEASLSVLKGLELKDLKVSEAPNLKAGMFAEAKEVRLRLRLLPLLRKQVQIVEVTLNGLHLSVVKKRDGRFNFSDLGGAKTPGTAAGKGSKAPGGDPVSGAAAAALSVTVSKARLKDAKIRYQDLQAGSRVEIQDLDLSADGFKMKGPFKLSLRVAGALAQASRKAAKPLKYELDLTARPDLAGLVMEEVQVTDLRAQVFLSGLRLSAEGDFKNALAPTVNLSVSLPAASLAALKDLAGGVALPPIVLPAVKCRAKASYSGEEVRAPSFELESGGLKAKGSARVWNLNAAVPSYSLDMETNSFPLGEWASLVDALKEYSLGGKLQAKLKASGGAGPLRYEGKLRLEGLSAKVAEQELSGLGGELDLAPGRATFSKVTGSLNGGKLALELQVKNFSAPEVHLEGSLSELKVKPLPPAPKTAPKKGASGKTTETASGSSTPLRLTGKFRVGNISHSNFQASESRFEWNLADATPDLKKLSGSAKFRVGKGTFKDLTELTKGSTIARVLLAPVLALQKGAKAVKLRLLPSFDDVTFSEIVGDYAFRDGLLTVVDSRIEGSALRTVTTGTADLGVDRLNLRVSVQTAGLATPLAFFVRGSLANPTALPDVAAVLKQPIVEKTVGQALDQGKKLLDNFFKK